MLDVGPDDSRTTDRFDGTEVTVLRTVDPAGLPASDAVPAVAAEAGDMAVTKKQRAELPSTLARSPRKAQDTFAETLASAEETYDGDERAAHRVAFGAVKHSFEKVGDHWEAKQAAGPSDDQAARPSGAGKRDHPRGTAGGVDANATKAHLLDLARRLDVRGRSTMSKAELVTALEKANDRSTARARG